MVLLHSFLFHYISFYLLFLQILLLFFMFFIITIIVNLFFHFYLTEFKSYIGTQFFSLNILFLQSIFHFLSSTKYDMDHLVFLTITVLNYWLLLVLLSKLMLPHYVLVFLHSQLYHQSRYTQIFSILPKYLDINYWNISGALAKPKSNRSN